MSQPVIQDAMLYKPHIDTIAHNERAKSHSVDPSTTAFSRCLSKPLLPSFGDGELIGETSSFDGARGKDEVESGDRSVLSLTGRKTPTSPASTVSTVSERTATRVHRL